MIYKGYLKCMLAVAIFVLICPFYCTNAASLDRAEEDTTTYNLYFGDLHAHTSYSDGVGAPEDAYASAIAGGADFMATTDHHYMLTYEDWEKTLQAAEEYTSENFVAIAGFEYFIPGWGEVNVFNVADFKMGVWDNGYRGTPHPTALPSFYDTLIQNPGAVGLWVHPTWGYSKEFDDFAYWNEERDIGIGMLEIHNYGNWEYYEQIDDEASFIKALDAGWHVMPTANSDTHAANWITGYECRTVLLAEDLTRGSLYEAMAAGRGYATIDKNLRVSYELNGAIMGSTLPSLTSAYIASIQIEDPDHVESDRITLVEIVTDGGEVIASLDCSSTMIDWTVPLSSETAHYFYVRISTASNVPDSAGLTAWTAPIWTGR